MKISVKTKPNAKETKLVMIDETHFEAWVNEPAKDGKANDAVVKLVAKGLGIPKSRVEIVHGLRSRVKTLEIDSTLDLVPLLRSPRLV